MEFLQYVLALIVTLGILVTVHEVGHFVIARASGVKILRFSIGFGRPLVSWFDRRGTEYAITALPLGGYVRMLDEREGDVAPQDAHLSFNRLSPSWRIAIALGGPLANFLLAILVYWTVFVVGTTDIVPIVDTPAAGTPAAVAGLGGGREIVAVDGTPTPGWAQITMAFAARLGDTGVIAITSREPGTTATTTADLPITRWQRGVAEPDLLGTLGVKPTLPAIVGDVVVDGPAAVAGLKAWDHIVSIDGAAVANWPDWVDAVRASAGRERTLEVERGGERLQIPIDVSTKRGADGAAFGFVGVSPLMREIKYSPAAAVPRALAETRDKTVLTLELLKKMVTGLVSARNLSGPGTIAKAAGDAARAGLASFLGVLALLSISLGVLNLLPIPVLDGGHVVLCATEIVLRRPVPERIQSITMQIGLAIVGGMMVLAVYNDLTRLFFPTQ
jgi:regulator of sigma E protease